MSHTPQYNLPKEITSRYIVQEELGSGGMGTVYLAVDSSLDRNVAIKMIKAHSSATHDLIARLDRECRMHAKIGAHPNIVTLYDRIDILDQIFLVLEYVKGEELGKLKGRLNYTEIGDIITQLLSGLSVIHNAKVVHRDIKPDNILISRTDGKLSCKLMDFGIAKQSDSGDNENQLTQVGMGGPGTPAYMAPEQIDQKKYGGLGPQTDIYAAGIIMYELMTGTVPFTGTVTEVLAGHLLSEPDIDKIGSIAPVGYKAILSRALAKKPNDRFKTANAFSATIKAVTDPELSRELDNDCNKTLLATPDITSLNEIDTSTIVSTGGVVTTGGAAGKFKPESRQPKWKSLSLRVGMIVVAIIVLSASLYRLTFNGENRDIKKISETNENGQRPLADRSGGQQDASGHTGVPPGVGPPITVNPSLSATDTLNSNRQEQVPYGIGPTPVNPQTDRHRDSATGNKISSRRINQKKKQRRHRDSGGGILGNVNDIKH